MEPLSRLEAVEAIRRLKARYFRFVDLKDWSSLERVFTADIEFDRTESASVKNLVTGEWEPPLPPHPLIVKGRGAIMQMIKKAVDGLMTVHHGHMAEIEVISDTSAKAIWPMNDSLRDVNGKFVLRGAGHYHEEYEKHSGIWAIRKIKLTRIYLEKL